MNPHIFRGNCNCPYCALDAKAGIVHEVCPYRIDLWIEQRDDGWYGCANLHDGNPSMKSGPHATRELAQDAVDKFIEHTKSVLGDIRVEQLS